MKRYNIFFPVHKGLRAMLYDTAISLQQTCFTNSDSTKDAIIKVETVIATFERHAHTEDTFVFPAIKNFDPGVIDAFEREHVEDHALCKQLTNWLTALGYAVSDAAKESAGEGLTKTFVQFMIFNLRHMAAEENIVNKLLWHFYTDAHLKQLTARIVANIEPAEMRVFTKWMLHAMNTNEIVDWLTEVKENAPAPMWQSLCSLAEEVLPNQRWQTVESRLNEVVLAA